MEIGTIAVGVFEATRLFYKGGTKAANKSYFGEGENKTGAKFETKEKVELESKHIFRNNDATRAFEILSTERDQSHNLIGKTLLENGRARWSSGNTAGNCGEMASVALCIAIDVYGLPKEKVRYCTIAHEHTIGMFTFDKRGFSHVFLLLDGSADQQWVVDPWAGVCCELKNYAEKMTKKMKKWHSEGKRLLAQTPRGTCWTSPTDKLLKGLIGTMKGTPRFRSMEPDYIISR